MRDKVADMLETKAIARLNMMSSVESDVRFTYFPYMRIYRVGVSACACGYDLWPTVFEAVNSLVKMYDEHPRPSLKPFSSLKSTSIPELMMKLDLREM
jgi:hypothetical protein